MVKTRSMTRNESYEPSSRKRMKTWSDLNHDVLFLVMMRLGVVNFIAFSGVCKSWRSLARSNRSNFMASKLPMVIRISIDTNEKDRYCYLTDIEPRRFKTILPHSAGRSCHGVTCGYLILFGRETNDFWLVNPITRHELHFPDVPLYVFHDPTKLRAILVFSPSISEWVFVMLNRFDDKIWFCIEGKGTWKHVSSTFPFVDLHAFKGKIYTLNSGHAPWEMIHLCEVRLHPQPRLTLLKTNNFPESHSYWDFVSSEENLYVMQHVTKDLHKVHEIDFGKLKLVLHEKTTDKHKFLLSSLKHGAAVKPELWAADPLSKTQYRRLADTNKSGKVRLFTDMWYFPNDCLNVIANIMWYYPNDCLNVNLIYE